jgi:hypothetical protein
MALQGHPSGVMSASFSADGKTLATVGAYHESGTGEVRLWDVASGQERGQLTHPGPVWSADFSPDGRTLATACRDGAVHLWELSTQHQRFRFPGAIQGPQTTAVPGPATPSQPGAIEAAPLAPPKVRSAFDAQWNDLASADAVRAYRALVVLTVAGDQAVPVLSERLQSKAEERAAPVDPQKLARWITDLDADAPEARDQAMAELKKLGRAAEPALRQAFKTAPSAEVHLRVEVLLEKLAAVPPEGVRGHRAIEALEHIGTPAARKALADLAERAVMAPWKDDARTSLARLERRAAP